MNLKQVWGLRKVAITGFFHCNAGKKYITIPTFIIWCTFWILLFCGDALLSPLNTISKKFGGKTMKYALYARVSKALEQNPENQLIELRKWAKASNNEIEGEYVDEISSRDTRPNKELILKKLRLGELDGVAFVALDRWGRNITELVLELDEFSKTNKSLMSLKEGLDLSTAAGRLMANLLAAMANFERDRIRERTMMGLSRAKSQGKISGRHPKNCGCGKNGHHGKVKPIRNESQVVIGWRYPNGKIKKINLQRAK